MNPPSFLMILALDFEDGFHYTAWPGMHTSSESFRSKPARTHLIMQHESLHLNSHELGFHFKVSNFFCWTDFKDNIFKPVETQHHTGERHVFR